MGEGVEEWVDQQGVANRSRLRWYGHRLTLDVILVRDVTLEEPDLLLVAVVTLDSSSYIGTVSCSILSEIVSGIS